MNHLCIDIGNTRIKYLVYIDKVPQKMETSKHWKSSIIEKASKKYKLDTIAVSSVRKNLPNKKYKWPNNIKVINLNHKTVVPIKNKYKTPKTLGNDRLAAAIGANGLYSGRNIVVVDFGTCIKFDFINAKGHYLGGNISPGVNMRIKAMHEYTSQLPLVDLVYNDNILGQSTEMALQNGAVRGTIFEVESFIRSMKEKYKKLIVIFTGGDADFFANYTNYKIFVHQNLVLQGLNKIIIHNEY